MEKHPIGDMMGSSLEKIREMIDVNTIIGKPITTPDGITIIPVSKVSFGFASGGSDFQGKNSGQDPNFGGGSGAGINITPVAFLVVTDGNVRVLNVLPPASTTIDRLLDTAPDIIDKVRGMLSKDE